MNALDSLLLGTIQGFTEFLPISSSGHLILFRELLGLNVQGGLAFDAILQLGTVLAVVVYFRKDIVELFKPQGRSLLASIAIGTIPALVLGLLLEKTMDTVFRSAILVAVMLIAGSVLFIVAEKAAKQTTNAATLGQAWWIGWFQTLALVPGVSRSGATISGGLLFGMTRESAARYSFLLSLPIIAGSGLKKLLDVVQAGGADTSYLNIAIGFAAAFFVGLACIRFLLTYLKRHTLYAFVWYRLALAAIVIVWTVAR